MIPEQQVHQLNKLGLNSYEAKAYLALLGRESFSASQVARHSGVPRQRIYDILACLIERGLAISRPSRRGCRYAGVSPKVALSALLEQEKQRIRHLQEEAALLTRELSSQYRAGQAQTTPLDYIEVLRGPSAISERFAQIQEQCTREMLLFTRPPYARLPHEYAGESKLLKRNIRARSLYQHDVLVDETMRPLLVAFIQQGEEARFVAELPMKLVIVDEQIVLFEMEDAVAGRNDLTILVIENPQFTRTMKAVFESYWSLGMHYRDACAHLKLPLEPPRSNSEAPWRISA